jgi:hypothetical protein
MADLTDERERDEADQQAEPQAEPEADAQKGEEGEEEQGVTMTPGQRAIAQACQDRIKASLERLQEISKPGREYGVPEDAERNALVNAISNILVDTGLITLEDLFLRKMKALAEIFEQVATSAEQHAASDTGLYGPDGETPLMAAPEPPRKVRRENARRAKKGK